MSKQPKPAIQYHVDGEPITNPSVNMLSGMAYFHTKDVDGCDHHVTTKRLKEILAGAGITDLAQPFEITLANGKRIHTTVGELAPKPDRRPGQHATSKSSTASSEPASTKRPLSESAAKRLERLGALKAEGNAVKDWKGGGEKGPRPPTPVTDAANAASEAEAAKRAAEPQQTAHVAVVKPTSTRRPPAAKKATTAKKATSSKPKAPASRTIKTAADDRRRIATRAGAARAS